MPMPLLLAAAALAAPPLDAVVLVEQGRSTCAGAVVSPSGQVATAYHCVASGGRPRVRTRDGRRAVGRVVGVRRDADLALLEVKELAGSPWIPLAPDVPGPGEAVTVLGHPYGNRPPQGFLEGTLRWSVSAGVVSAVGPRALQVDAPVNPGNSGGPVVDGEGRLVGVVSRKSAGGEGLGFAGRVEILGALAEAGPRSLGPLGGTVTLQPMISALDHRSSVVTVGPALEVSLRDRVVISGVWGLPVAARWAAVQTGEARFVGPEGRVGLRQRLGSGPLTVTLDALVGVGGVHHLEGRVEDDRVRLRRTVQTLPLGAGRLTVGAAGFEVGALADGTVRAAMSLRWPSVKTVF